MYSYDRKEQLPTFGGAEKEREGVCVSEESMLISEDGEDMVEGRDYQELSERLEENTIVFQREILRNFDELEIRVEELKREK